MAVCRRILSRTLRFLYVFLPLILASHSVSVLAQKSEFNRQRIQTTKPRMEYVTVSRSDMDSILEKEKDGSISTDRFKVTGKFGLTAQSLATTDSDQKGASAKFQAGFKYRFMEQVEGNVDLRLTMLSGRSQEGLGDEYLDRGITLKNGTIDWQPLRGVMITGGAVRQQRMVGLDLLVDSDATFPGLLQQFNYGNEYVGIELRTEQAIPTSRSLDTERQDKEELPSFFASRAGLVVTPNSHLQLKSYLGTFQFNDLPNQVAYNSSLRGNSVAECLEASCEFQMTYQGIFFGTEGLVRFNDNFEVVGFYSEVKNNRAPETINTAREIGTGLNIRTGQIVWSPHVKSYFAESDAVVAYYSSAELGGTNREGMATGIDIAFHKYKFKVDLDYVDSKVINPSSITKDKKYVYIGVETFNVQF